MLPGGRSQHFGVGAEVAEANWSIVPNLTAEVVQILKKRKRGWLVLLMLTENENIRCDTQSVVFGVLLSAVNKIDSPSGSCAALVVGLFWLPR